MDVIEFINSYWSFLAFIILVIGSWVRYETKVNTLAERDQEQQHAIEQIKAELKANDKIVNLLKQDLVEIKTILQFLKEKLDN